MISISINDYLEKNSLRSSIEKIFFGSCLILSVVIFSSSLILLMSNFIASSYALIMLIFGAASLYISLQFFFGINQHRLNLLMKNLTVVLPEKIKIDQKEIAYYLLDFQKYIRICLGNYQTDIFILDEKQIHESFDVKTQIPEFLQPEFQKDLENIMFRLLYLKGLINE